MKEMKRYRAKNIACLKGHCFDLSKKGYVNLLGHSTKTGYDKKMLASRHSLCESGFFSPMAEQVSALAAKALGPIRRSPVRILDAGCGEGSHLTQIINRLQSRMPLDFQGIGIDISKEGIQIAAATSPHIAWCVADLAKMPFKSGQFDAVLSILSPSNYAEFNRVLADDGILVKVVPGSRYLEELRAAFYDKREKQTYSNENVITHFSKHLGLIDQGLLSYDFMVTDADLPHLIKMTPISWRASDENIAKVLDSGLRHVTVDLTIILGKKKK